MDAIRRKVKIQGEIKMKRIIKERKCGTSKDKFTRFYLADKDLKGTSFEIGQKFSYEVDRESKTIRIVPESDLSFEGKVCRQRAGNDYVPLIVIRGKKIEEFAGSSKTMKVTIFEDEIVVIPVSDDESKPAKNVKGFEGLKQSIKTGFTSLCKNIISLADVRANRQEALMLSRQQLEYMAKRKVANGQLSLFDLGYTLSQDTVTQALAQTEQFAQDLEPLTQTLRVFEAFAGVGSQRMALRNIGVNHEVVGISEINQQALKSYQAIHGDCPNVGDISKLNVDDLPDFDLFTYSFPCQDLSVEGKQRGLAEGSGTRSSLLWECERVIQAKKPKYLLLENVKNLVGKKHKDDFMKWLDKLTALGYTNYWKIVNSAKHGIPQNRERVFVVSVLGAHEPYTFPVEEPLTHSAVDFLESEVDRSHYLKKTYDWMTCISDPKVARVPQATKDGFINLPIPGIADLSRMDSKTRRGRVQGNGTLCPTLTASQQDICFVDFEEDVQQFTARRLTPKEQWRLFGFSDDDYNKAAQAGVSPLQLAKQAGNSIVVTVLEGIFYQLFKGTQYLKEKIETGAKKLAKILPFQSHTTAFNH